MGQIFNRISRIAKAKFSDVQDTYQMPGMADTDADEDLKKAIDELNRDSGNSKSDKEQKKTEESFDSSKKMDIFLAAKILEINTNATPDEIKAAYKKLIKEYHPDKVATLGKDLQALAKEKTSAINAAYNFFREKYSI
jgi:DnaJ like chaperone protein